MAAIVCDLCGGKLVMGSGGIATCSECGMEYTAERIREKMQGAKSNVPAPKSQSNAQQIQNYLSMANNAYSAENQAEAETYCNKILEIEPTHHEAWFLKGKAAGWQSTLQNVRMSEAVAAFANAISHAPDDEKKNLKKLAKAELIKLGGAFINLRCNRFSQWPDEDEKNGLLSALITVRNSFSQFSSKTGMAIHKNEWSSEFVGSILSCVLTAYRDIVLAEYTNDPHRGEYQRAEFVDRTNRCIELLNAAVEISDNDEVNLVLYEALITLENSAIDSCSWEQQYNEFTNSWVWVKDRVLTDTAKNNRRENVRRYQRKINAIKEAKRQKEQEASKKRTEKYWAKNPEKKKQLEAEKKSLEETVYKLKDKCNNLPEVKEKANIAKRIEALHAEKEALGIFKIKEKKALQEQIDSANQEMTKINDRITDVLSELHATIDQHHSRIKAINTELNKAR